MALPDINLSHLRLMTDSTGLLQHARFSVPRYDEGYCIDDNARALLLMTHLEREAPDPVLAELAARYLAFVNHAFNADQGRFRNFMGYTRAWLEVQGSDDSHGRTLWALGVTAGQSRDPGRRALAEHLFQAGLPAARSFTDPRSWAYALLGIQGYLAAAPDDGRAASLATCLAGWLYQRYLGHAREDWPWFEDHLTYCNARLPQALMLAGARAGRRDWVTDALDALEWLAQVQTGPDGCFSPIGSNGFFIRGRSRARFDQQPVEACAMVSACLDAAALCGDARWEDRADTAFQWFLGRNHLNLPLYDPATGGCRDGLHAHAANQNLGAESTLSFLMALVAMRNFQERPALTPA